MTIAWLSRENSKKHRKQSGTSYPLAGRRRRLAGCQPARGRGAGGMVLRRLACRPQRVSSRVGTRTGTVEVPRSRCHHRNLGSLRTHFTVARVLCHRPAQDRGRKGARRPYRTEPQPFRKLQYISRCGCRSRGSTSNANWTGPGEAGSAKLRFARSQVICWRRGSPLPHYTHTSALVRHCIESIACAFLPSALVRACPWWYASHVGSIVGT